MIYQTSLVLKSRFCIRILSNQSFLFAEQYDGKKKDLEDKNIPAYLAWAAANYIWSMTAVPEIDQVMVWSYWPVRLQKAVYAFSLKAGESLSFMETRNKV